MTSAGGSGEARAPGDPVLFRVYGGAVTVAAAALTVLAVSEGNWRDRPAILAMWVALCAAANVLSVPATNNVYLSMSSAVNIGVAALFDPILAAAAVAVGSLSEWEIRRETTVSHALFNRSQLALSTAAASLLLSGPITAVPGPARTIGAVVVYQAVNWTLVALAERTSRGTAMRSILRRLLPAGPVAAFVYLALGLMGVALALTHLRVGAWAVAVLALPLLGARQAVRASRQIEEAERDQRALADRLIAERERERLRIASDIHDVALQDLAAVQLQADNITSALAAGDLALAADLTGRAKTGVEGTIADLRRSIASLRRVSLDEDGLAPTLERFARAFGADTGLEIEVVAAPGIDELSPAVALLVYETCQEALSNVVRHARASRATVALSVGDGRCELRVSDDGEGVGPGGPAGGGGAGLALARERLALAGGGLALEGRAEGGTDFVAWVTVPARDR